MATENGFIKLYRSMLSWEWYDDNITKAVFLHLLLTVNIKDNNWHGIEIKRGSRISSYSNLANELNLTIRQARTAITHLETTGEVTRLSHPKFTVFTLNNYDKFQQATSKTLDERHSNDKHFDKVATSKRQQYKKVKNIRNKEYMLHVCDSESADFESSAQPENEHDTTQTYGKFIKLRSEQYSELVSCYGQATVSEYIERIDNYIENSGKKPYANHYSTMKRWLDKDGINKQVPSEHSYDLDKLLNHALNNSPK